MYRMRFSVCLFLSQFLVFSTKALVGENVRQAEANQYGFVVSLMKILAGHPHSGGIHFCTGSLISRKDVLSAAHCLEGEDLNTVQIVVGTIDLRNGTIFYPFWWQTHDQWIVTHNLTMEFNWNDMANIRLIEAVSDHIIPVRLCSLSNEELYNANATTLGWGLNNQRIIPEIMNVGDLKILENRACEQKIRRLVRETINIDIRILCTYVSPFILVDDGDSGGPLMFRNRIVGVTHGSCPSNQRRRYKMNLHFGIHYYRVFINFMKSNV